VDGNVVKVARSDAERAPRCYFVFRIRKRRVDVSTCHLFALRVTRATSRVARRARAPGTMPELPEVESARALCEAHCLGATVTSVAFLEDGTFDEKIFEGTTAAAFRSALMGKTLVSARRLGKHMWWELGVKQGKHGKKAKPSFTDASPVFHFGMTGAMSVRGEGAMKYKSFEVDTTSWPPRFAKLVVEFDSGVALAYTDPRRFGKVRLVRGDVRTSPPISQLGFDPLLAMPNADAFVAAYAKRAAPIKAALLDQKIAAGVGNWIADEVLYQARVHPETPAKQLSRAQLERIRTEMGNVVRRSVEANADADAFPEDWLFHRRWGKVAGSVNGSRIEFITVGGRTTAFVPALQKKGKAGDDASEAEAKPAKKKRGAAAPAAPPPKKAKKAPPVKARNKAAAAAKPARKAAAKKAAPKKKK
jgi:formamidopyrimidine-DNA glycosylase